MELGSTKQELYEVGKLMADRIDEQAQEIERLKKRVKYQGDYKDAILREAKWQFEQAQRHQANLAKAVAVLKMIDCCVQYEPDGLSGRMKVMGISGSDVTRAHAAARAFLAAIAGEGGAG